MSIDPKEFGLVGVAGLGLMGRSIAGCLLSYGFRVIGFTTGADTYEKARAHIEVAIKDLITRAGFPSSIAHDWKHNFVEATALSDFAPCRFIIETVLEDLTIKREVFDQLEDAVREEVPIASNTSALPITLLQEGRRHPERFLGMHWAEPAHNTRFLELIRGAQTGDQAFQLAAELGQAVGKEPSFVQKDVPAFIVNRLGYAMYREAVHLLETGVADAATIDRSFQNVFGLWANFCGPLRWIDISGGPALYGKAMEVVLPSLCNETEVPKTMRDLKEAGCRGVINGRGFYDYGPDDAGDWEKRYHEHVWRVRELREKGDSE